MFFNLHDIVPQALTKKPLAEFAESFLSNQIFGEMYRNRMERSKKGLPDRGFNDLVTFYNAGIDHLATTLKVDFFTRNN